MPAWHAYDYESITVGAAAVGLTAAKVTAGGISKRAVISVETDQVRTRRDGTDPTAAEGELLDVGSTFYVEGDTNMRRLRFIRVTGDATIRVRYDEGG